MKSKKQKRAEALSRLEDSAAQIRVTLGKDADTNQRYLRKTSEAAYLRTILDRP